MSGFGNIPADTQTQPTAVIYSNPEMIWCLLAGSGGAYLGTLDWQNAFQKKRVLPCPEAFVNLRELTIIGLIWDSAWLSRLAHLRRLERLCLAVAAPSEGGQQAQDDANAPAAAAQQAGQPLMMLPPLPTVKSLDLIYYKQTPLAFDIDLRSLPSLVELALGAEHAAVTGAATLAGATALRQLELRSALAPWAPELLRHAPPSLRWLSVCGDWPPELAAAIATLTQLRVLSIDHKALPAALADGPACMAIWPRLRALQWHCPAPLPEVSGARCRLCWRLSCKRLPCSTASSCDSLLVEPDSHAWQCLA